MLLRGGRRARAGGGDRALIEHALATLSDATAPEEAKHDAALGPELRRGHRALPGPPRRGTLEQPLDVDVDRLRARFGAWYELFPRSWGGLRAASRRRCRSSPSSASTSLYLPPIHPIGMTNRKGRNNALTPAPGDPGQPVGDRRRRPAATTRSTRTSARWRTSPRWSRRAREHGIDIALDFAIQCSADHPWLTEHPEWFHRRPDGTLKYAENPPKRYQDIYNVNWESRGLARRCGTRCCDVVLLLGRPRRARSSASTTRTPSRSPFWEWLIARGPRPAPDVVFLAEAFTRRAVMRTLAQGRLQPVLHVLHLEELALGADASTSPSWPTPASRSTSAPTSSPTRRTSSPSTSSTAAARRSRRGSCWPRRSARRYGIYSGYETSRTRRCAPGSEEYLRLREVRGQAARARRAAAAADRAGSTRSAARTPRCSSSRTSRSWTPRNDALIAYAKQSRATTRSSASSTSTRISAQEGVAVIPASLGLPPGFPVHDLLGGERYEWRIGRNFVRLAPGAARPTCSGRA